MKIAILCKSPLLQKSLELFLSNYLSSVKKCDAVISDFEVETDKPVLSVGYENCDIDKPFTKTQLFMTLEKRFDRNIYEQEDMPEKIADEHKSDIDLSIIENELEELTDKYKSDILQLIKKYYAKK